ncbi:MAG: RNA-binding cell elongation regulator Jag/EloR [Treponemataceae bacterium]
MTYEYEGKTEKEAIEAAAADLGLEQDQFDIEILETQKNSIFKKGFVRICVHIDGLDSVQKQTHASNVLSVPSTSNMTMFANPEPQNEFETSIVNFVTSLIQKMGYQAQVDVMFRDDRKLGLKMVADNSPVLIGKKGKTLDALQLLANVYAGKLGHEGVKIILDTENYRIRREESLVRLAYNMADKVRTSRKSMLLEPMNPFERRLIHTTLNDIGDVETKSEGEGLYKQVRVLFRGARR